MFPFGGLVGLVSGFVLFLELGGGVEFGEVVSMNSSSAFPESEK